MHLRWEEGRADMGLAASLGDIALLVLAGATSGAVCWQGG